LPKPYFFGDFEKDPKDAIPYLSEPHPGTKSYIWSRKPFAELRVRGARVAALFPPDVFGSRTKSRVERISVVSPAKVTGKFSTGNDGYYVGNLQNIYAALPSDPRCYFSERNRIILGADGVLSGSRVGWVKGMTTELVNINDDAICITKLTSKALLQLNFVYGAKSSI
jgi:hypothetical protein